MRHHRVSETQKSPESPTDTGVTKGEVDAADAPPLAALWLRNDLALEEQGTASATTVCSARRGDAIPTAFEVSPDAEMPMRHPTGIR
jgi:hypothetical protein